MADMMVDSRFSNVLFVVDTITYRKGRCIVNATLASSHFLNPASVKIASRVMSPNLIHWITSSESLSTCCAGFCATSAQPIEAAEVSWVCTSRAESASPESGLTACRFSVCPFFCSKVSTLGEPPVTASTPVARTNLQTTPHHSSTPNRLLRKELVWFALTVRKHRNNTPPHLKYLLNVTPVSIRCRRTCLRFALRCRIFLTR